MADSKCANFDFALDVDSMTIDYILYKTIESQFRAIAVFSAQSPSEDTLSSRYMTSRTEARRLVEIFDSLIHLFHLHHPGVELNERIQFSTKILQFLILLHQHCNWSCGILATEESMPEQTIRRLEDEKTVSRIFRQHWMKQRFGQDIENRERPTFDELGTTKEPVTSVAHNLMIRFLELSEELAYGINLDQISDKWVQLAAEFMLQSAIETISGLNASPRFTTGLESEYMKNRLAECFAWGHIEKDRYLGNMHATVEAIESNAGNLEGSLRPAIEDRADLEVRISDTLFRQRNFPGSDSDTSMQSNLPAEPQNWTAARDEAWQEVLLTISSIQEADASQKMLPVKMLKDSHPFENFIGHLLDFIEKQWRLVGKSDWHGKPILVQIEEGAIDGMNDEDFQAFKKRVGI